MAESEVLEVVNRLSHRDRHSFLKSNLRARHRDIYEGILRERRDEHLNPRSLKTITSRHLNRLLRDGMITKTRGEYAITPRGLGSLNATPDIPGKEANIEWGEIIESQTQASYAIVKTPTLIAEREDTSKIKEAINRIVKEVEDLDTEQEINIVIKRRKTK